MLFNLYLFSDAHFNACKLIFSCHIHVICILSIKTRALMQENCRFCYITQSILQSIFCGVKTDTYGL